MLYKFSLDPGGQAESQGVKVGDQITEVNGVTFDNVTHAKAIQILTSDDHIIITLRVSPLELGFSFDCFTSNLRPLEDGVMEISPMLIIRKLVKIGSYNT